MRVIVIGLIVLALSVAGISTYLIQNFSTPEALGELEKKSRPVVNQVLVANMALNPGAVINGDAVSWREWPTDSMNENYISITEEDQKDARFKEVVDSRVRRLVSAGEPILISKLFKSDKPGFMAGVVGDGMRAMALDVNPLSGVAGFVLPGDRVDILLTHEQARAAMQQVSKNKAAQAGGEAAEQAEEGTMEIEVLRTATETILEDVLVLAVDQTTGPVEGQSIPARTLLFELTPKEVQLLTTAQTMGSLSVSLRNVGDDNVAADQAGQGDSKAKTYTTDVEVSAFLQKLTSTGDEDDATDTPVGEAISGEEETVEEKEIKALRRKLEAAKKNAQTAAAKKKNAQTLEIYRGGAAETEVIQIQ